MNKLRNTLNNESGLILPLVVFFSVIFISVSGFLFFISFNTFTSNTADDTSRLLALAAVEGYAGYKCSEQLPQGFTKEDCHGGKLTAGHQKVQEFIDSATGNNLFSGVNLTANGNCVQSGNNDCINVVFGNYIKDDDLCTDNLNSFTAGSSCFIPTTTGSGGTLDDPDFGYSNAARVFGALQSSNHEKSMGVTFLKSSLTGNSRYDNQIEFNNTATITPMKGVFVVDLSLSVSEQSHLGHKAACIEEYKHLESIGEITDPDKSFSQPDIRFGDICRILCEHKTPPPPSGYVDDTQDPCNDGEFVSRFASLPSFVIDNGRIGSNQIESKIFFEGIYENRTEREAAQPVSLHDNKFFHEKLTDYQIVTAMDGTRIGYDLSPVQSPDPTNNKIIETRFHPEPRTYEDDGITIVNEGFSGNIVARPTSAENPFFFSRAFALNLANNKDGNLETPPEPWLSIMKGLRTALNLYDERNVPGDQVGAIFYDNKLDWNRVIKLGEESVEYLKKVIDTEDMASPNNYNNSSIYGLPFANTPLWIKLALFPRTTIESDENRGTNPLPAFREAIDQLTKSGPSGTKFIAHIGDGVTTCSEDGECHDAFYPHYQSGMQGLEDFVLGDTTNNPPTPSAFLSDSGQVAVNLHMAQLGSSSHFYKSRRTGTSCLDGTSAAKLTEDRHTFLLTNPANTDFAKWWFHRALTPPYFVSGDWYKLVRPTGGLWVPILKNDNCSPSVPNESHNITDCSGVPLSAAHTFNWEDPAADPLGNSRLVVDDYLCRTVEEQIQFYIERIFNEGTSYTLVDPEFN